MKDGKLIIAVDFDATITNTHFPKCGELNEGCKETIEALKAKGHQVFLWTCRSDDYFMKAVFFCKENGLELDGYNKSPQTGFKYSGKEFADIYIDDSAVGAPLKPDGTVDWIAVSNWLQMNGVL